MLGDKARGQSKRNDDSHRGRATPKGIALSGIYSYVDRSIIINKRPELLTSIYNRYMEMCDDAEEEPLTSARNLLNNLVTI